MLQGVSPNTHTIAEHEKNKKTGQNFELGCDDDVDIIIIMSIDV